MRVASLLVALVGMTAVTEAAVLQRAPTEVDGLDRRQQGNNGGGRGNGNGGGGRGNGNGNGGGNVNGGGNGGNGNGNGGNGNGGNGNGNGNGGQNPLTSPALSQSVLNKGAQITGLENLDQNNGQKNGKKQQSKDDFAPNAPSQNNNINFCTQSKLDITNGLQNKQGSCNPNQGDIPSENNMVSTTITSPQMCENMPANKKMSLTAAMSGLNLGVFTNPDNTYYAAPQTLLNGKVIGHTHFVVQDMGNDFNSPVPLSAKKFAFFKGVNGAGVTNANGITTATEEITAGLKAGCYRFCTMVASATHQPVIMPIAQRGAQDSCTMFSVGQVDCGCAQTRKRQGGKKQGGQGGQGGGRQVQAGGKQGGRAGKQQGQVRAVGKQQGRNAAQGGR